MTATSAAAGITPTARGAPNDGVRRQVQTIAAQHAQRGLVHRRWRALDVLQYRRLRAGASLAEGILFSDVVCGPSMTRFSGDLHAAAGTGSN